MLPEAAVIYTRPRLPYLGQGHCWIISHLMKGEVSGRGNDNRLSRHHHAMPLASQHTDISRKG